MLFYLSFAALVLFRRATKKLSYFFLLTEIISVIKKVYTCTENIFSLIIILFSMSIKNVTLVLTNRQGHLLIILVVTEAQQGQ